MRIICSNASETVLCLNLNVRHEALNYNCIGCECVRLQSAAELNAMRAKCVGFIETTHRDGGPDGGDAHGREAGLLLLASRCATLNLCMIISSVCAAYLSVRTFQLVWNGLAAVVDCSHLLISF